MSKNRAKDYGTEFEYQFRNALNEVDGVEAKRIPGSGALGTITGWNNLDSDVIFSVPGIPVSWKVECKAGYGKKGSGEKSMTVFQKWFQGIREQADKTQSIPLVAMKFKSARGEAKHIVGFDLRGFIQLLRYVVKLYNENVTLREKYEQREERLERN